MMILETTEHAKYEVAIMDIKPIRTEKDYDAALKAIEDAWGAEPGSAEADRLEVMALLVKQYEEQHHPIPPPDPSFKRSL